MSADPRPPVICLHGLGRPVSDWDRVLPGLQAHGPVVVPSVPNRLADVEALLAETATEGSIVIGHSMGGVAALRFAADTQRRLRGLILTSCAFPPARNGRSRTATVADYAGHRVALVRDLIGGHTTTHSPRIETANALRSFAALASHDGGFARLVQEVTAPALIVHARDDHYVPVQFAMAVATAQPRWTLHLEDRGGHYVHMRASQPWLAAVDGWLSSH